MTLRTPPQYFDKEATSIFLAGSIEMDKAEKWQDFIIQKLADTSLLILNPRRAEWDSSWQQHKDAQPFREQVDWELDALQSADLILMYFDPATKAPISLLELGLFAHTGKMVVCCPEGFWRKGNVDIVCERWKIPQVENLKELADYARAYF